MISKSFHFCYIFHKYLCQVKNKELNYDAAYRTGILLGYRGKPAPERSV